MKIFFDERCLVADSLENLLPVWRVIADRVTQDSTVVQLYLDALAVRDAAFLQRFNRLRIDFRQIYSALLFGGRQLADWRPSSTPGRQCQISTEEEPVVDCGVCESYEQRRLDEHVALFGGDCSSYKLEHCVGLSEAGSMEPELTVHCGTGVPDLLRIGRAWGWLQVAYDASFTRPPTDAETSLSNEVRFVRTGRFERHGRRSVYREIATNHLYYVDNLHCGNAAHLEVFDAQEEHLGTASLDGVLNVGTRVAGRRISW